MSEACVCVLVCYFPHRIPWMWRQKKNCDLTQILRVLSLYAIFKLPLLPLPAFFFSSHRCLCAPFYLSDLGCVCIHGEPKCCWTFRFERCERVSDETRHTYRLQEHGRKCKRKQTEMKPHAHTPLSGRAKEKSMLFEQFGKRNRNEETRFKCLSKNERAMRTMNGHRIVAQWKTDKQNHRSHHSRNRNFVP